MSLDSIAPGDTRSIVLALQGLQEKVRSLEEDRNFHRAQCHEAHAAHEAYKREVEAQLDRERFEHRRREDEVQSLLRKATTEKRLIEDAAEAGRSDLSSFREQLSVILENERTEAKEREEALRRELMTYRSEILDLRSYHEKLSQTISQLRAERELILATNKRLEVTVADLIGMNNTILQGSNAKSVVPRRGRSVSASKDSQRSLPTHRHPSCSRRTCGDVSTMLASDRIASAYHNNDSSVQPIRPHTALNVSGVSSRAQSAAGMRNTTVSYADPTVSSMARVVEQKQLLRQPSPRRPSPSNRSVSHPVSDNGQALMDAVYAEVEAEHQQLVEAYKLRLQQPSPNQNEINDIIGVIDQKSEQLRLMRLARVGRDVAPPLDEGNGKTSLRTLSPSRTPRGTNKAVQRGAIVNQLRKMVGA